MTLALREIRRAKLRFALLAGAVGLLVFLILFQQTLFGTLVGYFTGALENQSGEVVVFNDEARRNLAGSILTEEQVAALDEVDGVGEAGPLGQGTFTVEADGAPTDAALFGYRLGGPGQPTRLVDGRLPEADGEAVASSIDAGSGFGIGDEVTLARGDMSITIVGLAADSRFSVQPVLFVSYETWQDATLATNPDATAVLPSAGLVIPEEGTDPEALAGRISEQVDGVEALDRATAVESLPGVAAVNQSLNLILLLAFVVVTLVVGFFFLIITVQKLPALGLLKAVGYGNSALVRSLLVQVGLVSLCGVVIGGAMLVVASALSTDEFPIEADPGLVATTGGAVFVLSLLASVGSVRRVTRVAATDVIARPSLGGVG